MSLSKTHAQKHLPAILALLIAVGVLLYYIFSGQGSLNTSTRLLQSSDPQVNSVQLTSGSHGDQTAQIKCQDGSTYEVYYPPGETNYSALSTTKCPQD